MVLLESLILGVAGSVIGLIITVAFMYSFGILINTSLDLPYLAPSGISVLCYVLLTFSCVVMAGALSGMIAAYRAVCVDIGKIIRE